MNVLFAKATFFSEMKVLGARSNVFFENGGSGGLKSSVFPKLKVMVNREMIVLGPKSNVFFRNEGSRAQKQRLFAK